MRPLRCAGLLYAASLWLSNSSYLYLSVSFIQMTKSLMPGLVYFSGCMFGTERFSSSILANMILIAAGVVVCAFGETNLIFGGMVVQLTALLFEATRLTLVQVCILQTSKPTCIVAWNRKTQPRNRTHHTSTLHRPCARYSRVLWKATMTSQSVLLWLPAPSASHALARAFTSHFMQNHKAHACGPIPGTHLDAPCSRLLCVSSLHQ